MSAKHARSFQTVFICISGVVLLTLILLPASGCKKKVTQPPATPNAQNGQQVAQPPADPTKPPELDVQDRSNPRPTGDTWVYVEQVEYNLGQTMEIEYKVKPTAGGKPWLGLIPITVDTLEEAANDAADVVYTYLDTTGNEGKVELRAPEKGDFFVRLFGTDADPKAISQGQSALIAIRDWPQGNLVGPRKPYVLLSGQQFQKPDEAEAPVHLKAGVKIEGTYELDAAYPDDAWIGLIPWKVYNRGAVESDAADVAYTYLEKGALSGKFSFDAPEPGEYVIRLFPCNIGDPTATFQSFKLVVE